MTVNNPGERNACSLPPRRFRQEILILAEQHSTEICRSIEQFRIWEFRCAIKLGRQNIDTAIHQCDRDSSPDMHVHVQCEAYGLLTRPKMPDTPLQGRFARLFFQLLVIPPPFFDLRVDFRTMIMVIRQCGIYLR